MADEMLLPTIRAQLGTAVIGDAMDLMGLTRQFLPPEIRALVPGPVLAGYAMPVQEADIVGEAPAEPFGLMLRALDDLRADEVYVCTGASPRYALWGGLMSTRARTLGAAGAVLDGFHRDTGEIRALGFPVFSTGAYAQDQRPRGHVVDFRCAITFANGARVAPGDVIVGDEDGVLAIPAASAPEVVRRAVEKVAGEAAVRRMIVAGEDTASVFSKTGIM
jgi:regulator of RNase E activity RraA